MSSVDTNSQTNSFDLPAFSLGGVGANPGATASQSPDADPLLVQQTKHQIRGLVHEIAQLAQSDCSVEDFHEGFLQRVTSALASVGGATWRIDEEGHARLQYQINLTQTRLDESEENQTRHNLLLRKITANGDSVLVAPQSGAADDEEAANPTDFLLVVGVIKVEQKVDTIVEVFQRAAGGPTTQRGYLRFLVQMCDLAADFLKDRQLRQLSDQQSLWNHVEQFVQRVHGSLDPRDVAFTLANEGRRLTQADRVSVAVRRAGRYRIEAVSGLDSIEQRSAEVRAMTRLASAVAAVGEPLWYRGEDDDLPPQIESVLHSFLDKSHAKSLAVVPLVARHEEDDVPSRTRTAPLGALIVERLADNRVSESFEQRVDVVARHGARALGNATNHASLFLLPLWRVLGKSRVIVAARNLPKTLLIVLAICLAVVALFVTPADFELSSGGTLLPQSRREVYAPIDGVLMEVTVPDDPTAIVEPGDLLARLENNELAEQIAILEGRKKETQKQIAAVNQMLLSDELRMTPIDEYRLDGQLKQLRATEQSIEDQLELQRKRQSELRITSPARGQVVTWQVRESLLRRPVNRGQRLMTVADPAGQWELELHVPERRIGHLVEAAGDSDDDLSVTFVLATHPGEEFQGRVTEIARTAEVRGEDGNSVLVRVALDKDELPDLRAGSKVTAKIHCGTRSLGYVIFQDLIETAQTKVLFWF